MSIEPSPAAPHTPFFFPHESHSNFSPLCRIPIPCLLSSRLPDECRLPSASSRRLSTGAIAVPSISFLVVSFSLSSNFVFYASNYWSRLLSRPFSTLRRFSHTIPPDVVPVTGPFYHLQIGSFAPLLIPFMNLLKHAITLSCGAVIL